MRNAGKWFGTFLIAHVAWVSLHALVNSQGLINPWEFGGYAMYTTPPTNVNFTLLLVRPEGNHDPHLPGVDQMRWWLEGGGCLLAFTTRRLEDVAMDMDRNDLDEVLVLFEKFDFSDDGNSLEFTEIAQLHGRTNSDGKIDMVLTGCGASKSYTVNT